MVAHGERHAGRQPRSAARSHPFWSFVAVGTLGFAVDASALTALVVGLDWSPYIARLVSFFAAVTVTWYCNRRFVFRPTALPRREYGAYVAVQVVGACINFGVYALIIAAFPETARVPVLPLAAGSALALWFNYAAARRWVFGGPA